MAGDDVLNAASLQHFCGNLAGESAAYRPVAVLCADLDVGALSRLNSGCDVYIRHASDNVAACVLNERSNGGDEFLCLRRGFVHFPVAGDNSLSNSLVHDFLFLSVG